jgi:secreted PhoX family phosphatase
MAVVDTLASGQLVLVRNHEVVTGSPFVARPGITYARDGGGGTTNLVFDGGEGRWLGASASLAGTTRNCAGGVTPWGTWITGEETPNPGHGWCFEVGSKGGDPTPLTAMGRFSHEAVMVDPRTGIIYETEDATDSGFYRFVPNVSGTLKAGGELYMLRVKNGRNLDLSRMGSVGATCDVEWVRIDDPSAVKERTYLQGAANGGARFSRLEGCWWGDQRGYFVSTDGGQAQKGQVFEYDPTAETLKLLYDSPTERDADNPDNITVTPRGGLLLCEDGGEPNLQPGERLVGLTFDGGTFTFAVNNMVLATAYNDQIPAGDYRQNEWAGACYSPDGRWLFANIQIPGVTFAITGPWGFGPL